jgi:hypothetical protein
VLGKRNSIKVFVLIGCLLITSLLVYWQPSSIVARKEKKLKQTMIEFQGWNVQETLPLDSEIVESLKLDDYIFWVFAKDNHLVTLTIGYYSTA